MNAFIETPRLILRPFRKSDHADLYEFLAQLEVDEFEGYPGITFENSRAQLDARIGSDEFLAMERKDNGKVIGNIDRGRRDFEAVEVGYIVGADFRREACLRQNSFFHRDADGKPIWKDTYIYARLREED